MLCYVMCGRQVDDEVLQAGMPEALHERQKTGELRVNLPRGGRS